MIFFSQNVGFGQGVRDLPTTISDMAGALLDGGC